jgi:hypothetical protein
MGGVTRLLLFGMILLGVYFYFTNPQDRVEVDARYRENVITLSAHVCVIGYAPQSEYLKAMDAPSRAFYAGSVIINSLGIKNEVISKTSKGYSLFYGLRIAEKYYNKIGEEWNRILPITCSINNNSSDTEIEEASRELTSFGFKTSYIILKVAGYEPSKAFYEGVYEALRAAGIDDENLSGAIRNKYGEEGVVLYDYAKKSGNVAIDLALPIIDKGLYSITGYVGYYFGPTFFKGAVLSKYTLENKIIPESEDFMRNLRNQTS